MKPSQHDLQQLDVDAVRRLLEVARSYESLTLLADLKKAHERRAQNPHNRSCTPGSRMPREYDPPADERAPADTTPPPGARTTRGRHDGKAEKRQTGKQMAAPGSVILKSSPPTTPGSGGPRSVSIVARRWAPLPQPGP